MQKIEPFPAPNIEIEIVAPDGHIGRNVSTTLRQPVFEFKLGFSAFGLAG
jgi:hypothetical protein